MELDGAHRDGQLVGGLGTHGVLTGHLGIPDATLFTDISKLEPGDEITIDVLDRDLVYRVTGNEVVDPMEIGVLGVVRGRISSPS